MKTLVLEIMIGYTEKPTISDSIKAQIEEFSRAKRLAEEEISEALKGMRAFRNQVRESLNKEVGEAVWKKRVEEGYNVGYYSIGYHRPKGMVIKLEFRTGIRRNTPYPEYELLFFVPLREYKLGTLEYLKIDGSPKLVLSAEGFKGKNILDLSEVHKELAPHYLTYFTNKTN